MQHRPVRAKAGGDKRNKPEPWVVVQIFVACPFGEFDRQAHQFIGLDRRHTPSRKAITAGLVAGRCHTFCANIEVRPCCCDNSLWIRLQQGRRPERIAEIATLCLELRRQAAVEDHRYAPSEGFNK